jgi:predicted RNA-binding Zn ribbon-like protein
VKIFESLGVREPGPLLADVQAAGFPMGGETLAIDLADTLVTVTSPPTDLIGDRAASDRFWKLHASSLPRGWALPTLADTRRIRDAIRILLDNAERGAAPDAAALAEIDAACAAVPRSDGIVLRGGRPEHIERWHAVDAAQLPLAAAARSAIAILTDEESRANLRRCASDACSMLFVKGDARRRWCTPNICSNRDRAARHYRRRRDA